jgi:hypothetical protein
MNPNEDNEDNFGAAERDELQAILKNLELEATALLALIKLRPCMEELQALNIVGFRMQAGLERLSELSEEWEQRQEEEVASLAARNDISQLKRMWDMGQKQE